MYRLRFTNFWESMNKIISYIGFAVRSGQFIAGQTPLKHSKKEIHLVLVCNTASDNLKDLAHNIANKFNCPCIITKPELSTLTKMENIKIFGITDFNLANAITLNKESIEIGKR